MKERTTGTSCIPYELPTHVLVLGGASPPPMQTVAGTQFGPFMERHHPYRRVVETEARPSAAPVARPPR